MFVPQNNNFVVFNQYFTGPTQPPIDSKGASTRFTESLAKAEVQEQAAL
jgi:hypothetical protein